MGEPRLIMPNLDVGSGMGVTRDGTLHYKVRVSRRRLKIAEIDMQTGKLLRKPFDAIERFVGANTRGAFSPDGEKLAYVSERKGWRRHAIVVRTLASGEEQEVPHQLGRVSKLAWQGGSARLWVEGEGQNGRYGFFDVHATSGESKFLPRIPGMSRAVWTPDGKRILYRNSRKDDGLLYSYSLADGSVETIPGKIGDGRRFSLSPDGKRIATKIHGSAILVSELEGGDGQVLWNTDESGRLGSWTVWTPDGKALLVLRQDAKDDGKDLWRLWIVPVDGSSPIATELRHELADSGAWPLDIHPDGKRIVYAASGYFWQFWALRNLPLGGQEQAAE